MHHHSLVICQKSLYLCIAGLNQLHSQHATTIISRMHPLESKCTLLNRNSPSFALTRFTPAPRLPLTLFSATCTQGHFQTHDDHTTTWEISLHIHGLLECELYVTSSKGHTYQPLVHTFGSTTLLGPSLQVRIPHPTCKQMLPYMCKLS